MDFTEVPLECIIVGPYNLRGEKADEQAAKSPSIERLSASILRRGYCTPSGSSRAGMAPTR